MRHDIKTFLELTDINIQQSLAVELRLRKHGHTVSKVHVNDVDIPSDYSITHVDLFDAVHLKIDLLEFTEGSSAIEIEYFGINGYEILPKYRHLANNPINYIDKLGVWSMEIPAPFYIWYHTISGNGWIA